MEKRRNYLLKVAVAALCAFNLYTPSFGNMRRMLTKLPQGARFLRPQGVRLQHTNSPESLRERVVNLRRRADNLGRGVDELGRSVDSLGRTLRCAEFAALGLVTWTVYELYQVFKLNEERERLGNVTIAGAKEAVKTLETQHAEIRERISNLTGEFDDVSTTAGELKKQLAALAGDDSE